MKISPNHIKAIKERMPEGQRQAFVDRAIASALNSLPQGTKKQEKNTRGEIELFVDGGSRGNPGPSGGGYAAYRDGKLVFKGGQFFGSKTNNQAEYLALREALREVYTHFGDAPIKCFMDSQLAVEQLNGNYKVKSDNIKPLHEEISAIKEQFQSFSIQHIPREKNKLADKMANEAMDHRV